MVDRVLHLFLVAVGVLCKPNKVGFFPPEPCSSLISFLSHSQLQTFIFIFLGVPDIVSLIQIFFLTLTLIVEI